MSSIFTWQNIKPNLIALGIFFVVVFIFCKPAFEGKVILSTDGVQFNAMYNNMAESKEVKNGQEVHWNKNLFAGMPFNFQDNNLISFVSKFVFNFLIMKLWATLILAGIINWTSFYFLLSCIGFYFLCRVLKINFIISIVASLAYAYGVQTSILVIAGHHTKLVAFAMLPTIISGIILITQKRYWLGAIISIFAFSYAISWEHYQMIFYILVTIFFISLGYLIYAIKNKISYKHIFLSGLTIIISIAIAFSFFIPKLISYEEYSKETIRGGSKIIDKSNLKSKAAIAKTGLDKDYAFNWSYGILETLTFIAPNVYGGASGGLLKEKSKSYEKLTELGVPEDQALNIVSSFDTYWGNQPFTLGPIYFGVLIMIILVLCIIYYRSWLMWSLLSLTILTIFIALGKNFSTLNYFIFDHLPYYNKFRAPTMILTVTQFSISLLVALGLQNIFIDNFKNINKDKFIKNVLYISSAFTIILGMFYFSSNFSSANDSNFLMQLKQMTGDKNEISNDILNALKSDRKAMLFSDLIYLILLSIAFLISIFYYIKNKINFNLFIIIVGVIITFDEIQTSKNYLNYDRFQDSPYDENGNGDKIYPKSTADELIFKDKDPNFRVFDISSKNVFNDASVSYYHRSVGGYFAAKLSIYQDLIDSQLSKMNLSVLNMLNTRYFIKDNEKGQKNIMFNPDACGACWFIKEITLVNDTREEIMALTKFNPNTTAFVENSYKALINKTKFDLDTSAKIISTYTSNNTMKYESNSKTPQFAVFSEIFYDKSWKAYIDGKFVPTIKTNYVLRGLEIPAGKHKIEFLYELTKFKKGLPYQTLGSMLFLLLLLLFGYFEFLPFIKKKK